MDSPREGRHVLAAIDTRFKAGTGAVCDFVCKTVYREGDTVDFVCVMRGPRIGNADEALYTQAKEDILASCSEAAGNMLVREIPYEVHVVLIPEHTDSHHVVETVIEVAQKIKAVMVVVGTHGRSSVTEMLLGSVASGLIRRSPMDVAVVRPTP